ncbi:cytochrome P450 [Neomicrococcus lactis]|uniref:Cytochrome P450 n=1 Tax=Neomicrococcus lactis TaxID=732241 RepID=A0A7W9DC42_9MICC|nr:cytochrome P450 [Neomicrococcus lactis]MBB5598522.1 hypothetical protein [Neomicrococcus lactis]
MSISAEISTPRLDLDPFSDESLLDPYPIEDEVREAGEVVWLEKYGVWASGRHQRVTEVFGDHEKFISSHGTGFTNTFLTENWRKPSAILEADPPEHSRVRTVMVQALSQKVVKGLKESFQRIADEVVLTALEHSELDAMQDLAVAFPLRALPDAIGLAPEGRKHLLTYANLNFQAMGPRNGRYEEALAGATDAAEYVEWQMRRENLGTEGIAAAIFARVDSGEITESEGSLLVRAFLSAGLDTTMLGIGNALVALSENPAQWKLFKEDPEKLARKVFEETLRLFAPSPFIGRTVGVDMEFAGIQLQKEDKFINFVSAANRDPRKWANPEHFDIARDTRGHVAFGYGIHACVGQMMARMEAETLLSAVGRHVAHLEVAAAPTRKLNNWLRGYEHIPMAFKAE